ncbi:TonB-dependent receptor [Azorhizobium oxalatiphilum]|uniref:TonB-dependent receptor n=1 Tax=Azorhizobium oxalatiphilum TaxID=980631 RepID=A0A917FDC5_9HYPH|nr:TonB-dependent receptor [Azorhizobium oxalatiphilum]
MSLEKSFWRRQATSVSLLTLLGSASWSSAQAQQSEGTIELATVSVQAASAAEQLVLPNIEKLKISSETGSLVGLTPFETPASVDIVTQQEMQDRGLDSLVQVYNSVPGVMSGNAPGTPGATSIRGFSGGAVSYMFDGMQAPDSQFMSRNLDSFTFDRVEVLKGPSSVISGNGALAGTINLVTKQPILGRNTGQALLSYGSFGTVRVGADYNVALGQNAALRASGVYSQSNGYVDDTDTKTAAISLGATVALSDRLTTTTSLDYFHDDLRTPYEGTPLIAASAAISPTGVVSAPNGLVLDRALRNRNYNVYDGKMGSDSVWLRNRTEYELSDNWTIRNDLGYYTSDRDWSNSEEFMYNAGTGLLDRSAVLITHDQQVLSEQISARFDGALGGMRHRFAVGLGYTNTEFSTQRYFGMTTPVSPYFPDRGFFPPTTAANFSTRENLSSTVDTYAVFAEDAVNITDKWLVVGGIRYETIKIEQSTFDLNALSSAGFDADYESVSYRLGTVYEILPGTVLFAQYNQATIPVSSLLLANIDSAKFELSTGTSIEAGVKSTFWNNRAVASASVFQIEQDNILTPSAANPALTVQGGSQRSRGVEAELAIALTDQLKLTTNVSYTKSEYTNLLDSSGMSLAGNRPTNVPEWTYFLMADYKVPTLPMTVSASLQYVSSFYTNTANTIEVAGHTVVDAWISYDVGPGTLRLRGRNLTDAFYGEWSGYNSQHIYIGAPRSVELSYTAKF